ncbi:MAG: hypothetical protein V4561_04705 [Bacteroidota bacterium]
MRYLFLILVFIANLSATTSGQLSSWTIPHDNVGHGFSIKHKGHSDNLPLSFFENYTVEDTTEDTVDENDSPLTGAISCLRFSFRRSLLEKKCPLSKQKIRQRITSSTPIFIRDNQFLI